MKFDFPVAFLDIDGVLNRVEDENGLPDPSHIESLDPEHYGISDVLVKRFIRFARNNGVKAILSTNWRRLPKEVEIYGRMYTNPIQKVKDALGDVFYSILPPDHHVNKSEQLMLVEEDFGKIETPFVIFDDMDEGFGANPRYSSHFVRTDRMHGLMPKDIAKATRILKR